MTIHELDDALANVTFTGPRQARPTDPWTGDSRDLGSVTIDAGEIVPGDLADQAVTFHRSRTAVTV